MNGRTLTVLVNHWIATRTGQNEEKSKGERTFTAATVKAIIDRILEKEPGREVIVLGDFNEGLDGEGLSDGLKKAAWLIGDHFDGS